MVSIAAQTSDTSPIEPVRGVVAVVEHDGRLLVIRRAGGIAAAGSWCFPGGAIESGESPVEALVREMQEEVGAQVLPLHELWEWHRPDGGLVLSWWRVALLSDPADLCPAPAEVAEIRWSTPDEIRCLTPLLPSNRAFLNEFWPQQ